jgi:hypothetical protein
MIISIFSKDYMAVPESKGKTTAFKGEFFDIKAETGTICVQGVTEDPKGSGARGGIMKDMNRSANVEFTASEMEKLAKAAVAAGILVLDISAPRFS